MFLKNPNTALLGIIGISLMGLSLLGWMQTPDPALAKGPPDKVTIRAPGMSEEVEITDPQLLQAFAFFGFEDIPHPVDPPLHPGEGVVITRYIREGEQRIPWDRLIYYPPRNGAPGVVFLEGLIGPASTPFDGSWYFASPEGDRAMRQILQERGTRGTPGANLRGLALGGALLLLGVLGIFRAWRRS
ncbi:hypothetical protein [Thermoflexus sp.]|uniref:hypothetical protein n=1 Tax=Thermoflexus sp. TaxID=1969742 RepID=UPI0017791C0B|nr:hypothetical protein [Thermoflexus sp.]